MNVRTEQQTDGQTDRLHKLHVYVRLAQGCPNYIQLIIDMFAITDIDLYHE